MKFLITAALVVSGLAPSAAVQAQANPSLSVASQSALPACSKTVTSNCRKRNKNGTWLIVGAGIAAAAVVAVAAGGKSKAGSP